MSRNGRTGRAADESGADRQATAADRPRDDAVRDAAAQAQFRQLMSASQEIALAAVALNSSGASLLGMHSNDVFCLWHVTEAAAEAPVSSGQLAELTGLTTGAITGVIDRLEAAGFVRRERDPQDRRRQLVRPVWEQVARIYALYEPLVRAFGELEARYDVESRTLLHDYLRRLSAIMRDHVHLLRESVKDGGSPP